MENAKHFTARLPVRLIVKLKVTAAREQTSAQAILIKALEAYFGRKKEHSDGCP